MSNGKGVRRWRLERNLPAVTTAALEHSRGATEERAGIAIAEFITLHAAWIADGDDLAWLTQFQAEVGLAMQDVYECHALRDIRDQVEATEKWRTVDQKQWHKGKGDEFTSSGAI